MTFIIENYLKERLIQREQVDALRSLSHEQSLIDFCSNDYLGFARSSELKNRIEQFAIHDTQSKVGATGSRLLTGNTRFAEELEDFLAGYHKAEAGLIYNSGYVANLGLLSCLLQKEHFVLYDELVHVSIHQGIQLGKAPSFPFLHNDLNHLEDRLKDLNGIKWVVVESVYSMDGDFSPLKEMVLLCKKYNAHLIVDEAHATGLYGKKGEGRVVEIGLENDVYARVHTFGKAVGCHGAVVVGSKILRDYLINFSRPFIYTTALPFHSLIAIKYAYDMLSCCNDKILFIKNMIGLFKQEVQGMDNVYKLESESPIQGVIIPGNVQVKTVAAKIQNAGFDVRPILSPTIPRGKERLRICLHAFNTIEEMKGMVKAIKQSTIA